MLSSSSTPEEFETVIDQIVYLKDNPLTSADSLQFSVLIDGLDLLCSKVRRDNSQQSGQTTFY